MAAAQAAENHRDDTCYESYETLVLQITTKLDALNALKLGIIIKSHHI